MIALISLNTCCGKFLFTIESIILILQLGVIAWTAIFVKNQAKAALKQVEHIKRNSELEILIKVNERLFQRKCFKNRGTIYSNVPHPIDDEEEYSKWLTYKRTPDTNRAINEELAEFDVCGLYLKDSGHALDTFIRNWYDVLARFIVLLSPWISKERTLRGEAYLPNVLWLFEKTIEYMEENGITEVGFYVTNEDGVREPSSFKIKDIIESFFNIKIKQ